MTVQRVGAGRCGVQILAANHRAPPAVEHPAPLSVEEQRVDPDDARHRSKQGRPGTDVEDLQRAPARAAVVPDGEQATVRGPRGPRQQSLTVQRGREDGTTLGVVDVERVPPATCHDRAVAKSREHGLYARFPPREHLRCAPAMRQDPDPAVAELHQGRGGPSSEAGALQGTEIEG